MAKKKQPKGEEVIVEMPDLGLSDAQIRSLKKAFKNELVNTLKTTAGPRAIVSPVDLRVQMVREIDD
jgi:hypothetical protein